MRLMEQIQALRSALTGVPRTLLTTDTARVLDGIFSSLEIIERSEADRPVVVLVGPTGAGKSHIFNAIIGVDASPEGVLRPTTSSVVIAGELSLSLDRHTTDAVILPRADIGFTLVDMPESDGSLPATSGLVAGADLVVMVVSPIRYADATVAALWESLDPSRAAIVLNRVTTHGEESRVLLASVNDMFDAQPYVIGEGGQGRASIAEHISGLIPASRSDSVASIMIRAAGSSTRFVVREVTNAAPDIGEVAGAVDSIPDCVTDTSRYDVQMSWDGTRDEILNRVGIDIRDRDDDIVRTSGTELAERILEGIGPWEDEDLSGALDSWRESCISRFSDASSVRWRRTNAQQLIERFSWSTAMDSAIVAPKRFTRIMGANLDETTSQMLSALQIVVCGSLDARLDAWRGQLDRLGDYQPGVLASAADALESHRHSSG
jgi:energy-coupling factor transporter ATP-binding protein EcfA2